MTEMSFLKHMQILFNVLGTLKLHYSVISYDFMIIYDKTMEEAVFKRPISLFWVERVRKLVTPSWETGRRPF
jgi:hypothetical protein